MTTRLAKVERKINSLNKNFELKNFDQNISETMFDRNRIIFNTLLFPGQGVGISQRIGDRITLKHLKISIALNNSISATATNASSIRVIIIYDKKNTIADASEVLSVTASAQVILSDYNPQHRQDYVILHDRLYTVDEQFKFSNVFKLFVQLKNKVTEFSPGTSVLQAGAMKIFFLTNVASSATDEPTFAFYSRVSYTDA